LTLLVCLGWSRWQKQLHIQRQVVSVTLSHPAEPRLLSTEDGTACYVLQPWVPHPQTEDSAKNKQSFKEPVAQSHIIMMMRDTSFGVGE
jgi:hypothetical protein